MSLATAGLEAPTRVQPPSEPLPNPNKALWEKGDFTRLAATMRESGDEVIESLGVGPGMTVLDLGCGDGTTAVPSARRGAQVLGVDIASNLVAAGNARAEQAGLANLAFEEGDASHLDALADDSFDLVVSVFGAMLPLEPGASASKSSSSVPPEESVPAVLLRNVMPSAFAAVSWSIVIE